MRILHISSARTFGGGERHLVDLCRELHGRGHEVFVALRPTNEWQGKLEFLPAENFLHVSIRNSFGMFSAKRIGRFVRRKKIDVIHAHVARDYLAASIASRVANQGKLVLTRHVVFPMKPFHRFALRNVDAAIGVSPAVSSQLERIFPRKKVHLISNGLAFVEADRDHDDLRRVFRELHSIPADCPLVVTMGELLVLKGQRDFVLAAHEVVKRVPDCRFVIAGKDNSLDQGFRRELKRLAKILGLEDRILWLDWLDDIGPLLAAADLFVSPSHSESFGLAILEAMLAGVPVVATATDGGKELIPQTEALFPIHDPVAMADTICSYLEDETKRKTLAGSLRTSARERFTLTRMVDDTEALYLRILADG